MSKGNCVCRACALCVVVYLGALLMAVNGYASPTAGADAANMKHPPSIAQEVNLANKYLFGQGVARDSKAAEYWLQKAAGAGDPQAQMELGYFYEAGIGAPRNMELAAHWYRLAAHAGEPEAKANLGLLYFWGEGVPQDREMAARLFREAAEKGSGKAASKLASMYAIGTGVPQDKATAEQWYAKGAKAHNPEAEYQLGLLFFDEPDHKTDLRKAEKLLRSSAESNFVPALYALGLLLARHPDLAKSPAEAAQFLQESANAGNWKSSEVLGALARDGNGVPKDLHAAYFHFRVAALQGGKEAQKELETDLKRLQATLAPTLTSALDSEAQQWYSAHHVVLEFIHQSSPDGKTKYPEYVLAAPEKGEHELQMLPARPDAHSGEHGLETAQVSVE